MLSERDIGKEDCGKCTPRVSRTIRGKHFYATKPHKHTQRCFAGIRQVCFCSQPKAERIKPHYLAYANCPMAKCIHLPHLLYSLWSLYLSSIIPKSLPPPTSLSLFVFFCLSLCLCKLTQPRPIRELRFTASRISANQKPALNAHGQIHSGTSFGSYIVHLKYKELTMRMLAL